MKVKWLVDDHFLPMGGEVVRFIGGGFALMDDLHWYKTYRLVVEWHLSELSLGKVID